MATIEKMVMATSDDQVLNLEKKNEKNKTLWPQGKGIR
jgi:hypothetical protein